MGRLLPPPSARTPGDEQLYPDVTAPAWHTRVRWPGRSARSAALHGPTSAHRVQWRLGSPRDRIFSAFRVPVVAPFVLHRRTLPIFECSRRVLTSAGRARSPTRPARYRSCPRCCRSRLLGTGLEDHSLGPLSHLGAELPRRRHDLHVRVGSEPPPHPLRFSGAGADRRDRERQEQRQREPDLTVIQTRVITTCREARRPGGPGRLSRRQRTFSGAALRDELLRWSGTGVSCTPRGPNRWLVGFSSHPGTS